MLYHIISYQIHILYIEIERNTRDYYTLMPIPKAQRFDENNGMTYKHINIGIINNHDSDNNTDDDDCGNFTLHITDERTYPSRA